MDIAEDLMQLVGRTPLLRLRKVAPSDGPQIVAKLEQFNPGGSVKDRIGLSLIRAGEASGKLQPGGVIVEPTSGNTGVGLAIAATVLGYRMICTVPDKVPVEKIRLLQAYGVEVHVCPTSVPAEDPASYYSVAARLAAEHNAYRPDQYSNAANPAAHYASTGPEIWTATEGQVTAFVAGMGTGGTITGTGRFLKEQDAGVRIIGVDTVGSVLRDAWEHDGKFTVEPHTYLIDGIGEDMVPKALDLSVVDDVVTCSDRDAYRMAMRLAREEGLLVGSSAGAAVWGALQAARSMSKDDLVVVLIPDSGERYLSKLNGTWLKEHGLADNDEVVAE